MSDNRTSSGGVRNLRAMFENNGTASPSSESRGRSPAGSVTSNGERPLSKVRTSFVSVEPSGNGMSTLTADRRESFSLSKEEGAEIRQTISQEQRPVPENALVTPAPTPKPITQTRPETGLAEEVGTKLKEWASPEEDAPTEHPDKPVSAEEEDVSLKPSDPKDTSAVSGGEALPPPAEPLPKLASKQEQKVPKTGQQPASVGRLDGTVVSSQEGTATNGHPSSAPTQTPSKSPASARKSSQPSKTPTRPKPISTAKEDRGSKASPKATPASSSKSPAVVPKTPTSASLASTAGSKPAKSSPAKSAASPKPLSAIDKQPDKAATPKPRRSSLRDSTASTAAKAQDSAKTTSITAAVKKPIQPSPKAKPRPKSPTRPIQLPSHLTASTASSAAKHESQRTQNGSSSTSTGLARKPSTLNRDRASTSTKPPSTTNGTAPVRKQPSRPSLPTQQPRRPESRTAASASTTKRPGSRTATHAAKPPDAGLLARMMRPTASSASKTHEKVEAKTPPKATGVRRTNSVKPAGGVASGKLREVMGGGNKGAVVDGQGKGGPANGKRVVDGESKSKGKANGMPSTTERGAGTGEAGRKGSAAVMTNGDADEEQSKPGRSVNVEIPSGEMGATPDFGGAASAR